MKVTGQALSHQLESTVGNPIVSTASLPPRPQTHHGGQRPQTHHGARLYYDKSASTPRPPSRQQDKGPTPAWLQKTVNPTVLATLMEKIGDMKDRTITINTIMRFVKKEAFKFDGGEALLRSMFSEADLQKRGVMSASDLKAALTERFAWRRHNGDWRRLAQRITKMDDITDPGRKEKKVAPPVFTGMEHGESTTDGFAHRPRQSTSHSKARPRRPTAAWSSFKDRMQDESAEDRELLTTFGTKTLTNTPTELKLNRAIQAGVDKHGQSVPAVTKDATAMFSAFNHCLQHRENPLIDIKQRQELYTRPSTAPAPTTIHMLQDKRREKEKDLSSRRSMLVQNYAVKEPKTTFNTLPIRTLNYDLLKQAKADEAGFAGDFIDPELRANPFRKPAPGDPGDAGMIGEILEHAWEPLTDHPLFPTSCALDREKCLGYAVDVRLHPTREVEAVGKPSSGASKIMPPMVKRLNPDPATLIKPKYPLHITVSTRKTKHRPTSPNKKVQTAEEARMRGKKANLLMRPQESKKRSTWLGPMGFDYPYISKQESMKMYTATLTVPVGSMDFVTGINKKIPDFRAGTANSGSRRASYHN